MLKQINDIWKNNNGTMLFTWSVSIAVAMSVLWRFDMIPDIGPAMRSSPMVLGGRARPMPNIVVVSITADQMPDAEVTMQVFSAPDIGSETMSPLETHSHRLEEGLCEFLITSLPRSTFAGMAFIDVNGNSQIDLNKDGTPAEPFGFVKSKIVDELQSTANGVFEVRGDPVFIKIHLVNPTNPVAPAQRSEKK